MSEAKDMNGSANEAQASFRMAGQYVKDLSFEVSQPVTFEQGRSTDYDMNLEVSVGAKPVSDNAYETLIVLKGTGTAQGDEKSPLFVAEVHMAGLFEVANIPQDKLMPLLAIDGALLIFPQARHAFMDAIANGGFTPKVLEPINFAGLYMQAQQAHESGENGEAKVMNA